MGCLANFWKTSFEKTFFLRGRVRWIWVWSTKIDLVCLSPVGYGIFVGWRVARSRTQLYFSQRCSNRQHHCTVYLSHVKQLVSQFYGSFNKGACEHFLFSFRGALRDKLTRKLHSATGPRHQTSATWNATFSTIARQVAKKIAVWQGLNGENC